MYGQSQGRTYVQERMPMMFPKNRQTPITSGSFLTLKGDTPDDTDDLYVDLSFPGPKPYISLLYMYTYTHIHFLLYHHIYL